MTRRDFHKLLLAGITAAMTPAGCSRSADYTDDDATGLARRMAEEAAQSGVDLADSRQTGLHQIFGRNRTVANPARSISGGEQVQIGETHGWKIGVLE